MRYFFWIALILFLVMFGDKLLGLVASGKIFDSEEVKKVFRQGGKNLWWGMKMFVILWFIYLIFIWWVRNR
ncbi:MAG TPA: hypothetical protein PLP19_13165 [bacterium]|nr:hypothetical protein [bacterium]HPN44436.1 hypothetical protein [bacterium]